MRTQPYASDITNTQAVIRWQTDEPATSTVRYGTNPANLDSQAVISGLTTNHAITLVNLVPQTTYYFIAISLDISINGSECSPAGPFTTQATDNTPGPFTFIDQTGVALNTVIIQTA